MKNYYAVRTGYHTGIYDHLEDARDEILGYSYAEWKGFDHYNDAQEYLDESSDSDEDEEDARFWVYEDGIYNCRELAYQSSDGKWCEPFESFQDAVDEVLESYDERQYFPREDLQYVDEDGDTIYQVYVDGACVNNGREDAIAGIGVYFGSNNPCSTSQRLRSGLQTNQRAELAAIKKAYEIIGFLNDGDYYEIYSDSAYAINCLTKWHLSWEKNGWKTWKKTAVANQDLVKAILELRERPECQYVCGLVKVPAHSDCEGNREADELAVSACD